MGKILEVRVPGLPVQWSRARGRYRFTHESLREWQKELRDIAEEEIVLQCEKIKFPFDGPLHVDIGVLLGDEPETRITLSPSSYVPTEFKGLAQFLLRDGDNIEKGIFDAFSQRSCKDDRGLWTDDSLRYIPSHSFALL